MRSVKGSCLHPQISNSTLLKKFLHTCAKCSESPSNISTIGVDQVLGDQEVTANIY